MSDSSQEKSYTVTLDSNAIDSITVYGNRYSYDSMLNTVTLNSDTVISTDFLYPKEWENSFPDWFVVKAMIKEYPALEKAFENFKTVYEIVKDDYDSKNKGTVL